MLVCYSRPMFEATGAAASESASSKQAAPYDGVGNTQEVNGSVRVRDLWSTASWPSPHPARAQLSACPFHVLLLHFLVATRNRIVRFRTQKSQEAVTIIAERGRWCHVDGLHGPMPQPMRWRLLRISTVRRHFSSLKSMTGRDRGGMEGSGIIERPVRGCIDRARCRQLAKKPEEMQENDHPPARESRRGA